MAKRTYIFIVLLALNGCSLIDDDLSVCNEQITINYHLQLHTDLSVQLQRELATEQEEPVRRALEQWLDPVFADTSVDLDLRFYTEVQDRLVMRRQGQMTGSHTSFTVTLPKANFAHVTLAHLQGNPQMQVTNGEHSSTMNLCLNSSDRLSGLQSAYTARKTIEVNDSTERIDVSLYMVTSAVAVVIESLACTDLTAVDGYVSGGAGGFAVWDSTYTFTPSPDIQLEQVPLPGAGKAPDRVRNGNQPAYICMAAVCMPTPDNTKWSVRLTATLTEDRHTTTTLSLSDPLAAGQLRIIKLQMNEDGELVPVTGSQIGATVEVDWDNGSSHEIII